MTELTVVIPTKDRPNLLPRAVGSVLDQAPNAEVIVVDDGSNQGNAATVRFFCERDPRIVLFRNEVPGGAPHARNQGMEAARGRYWATLDDDDMWLPGKWVAQRNLLERHGFSEDVVAVTAVRLSHLDRLGPNEIPSVPEPQRFASLTDLFRHVPPRAFLNSYIAATSLMRSIGGYDPRLIWGEHTDVLIRLSEQARFVSCEHLGVLVHKRHEDMASRVGRDWNRKVEGIRLLLEKHAPQFSREPGLRALYLHVLGISQLRAGDRWGAASTLVRVFTEAPSFSRRTRALGHLLLVALGGAGLWRAFSRIRGIPAESLG